MHFCLGFVPACGREGKYLSAQIFSKKHDHTASIVKVEVSKQWADPKPLCLLVSAVGSAPRCAWHMSLYFNQDYQTNDNDQAVVEICITRITTAIRETESIEKHGKALVALWESCLEHNLKPSGKDEDTPHAKIASDIMSCILQNYSRPSVMALAVPVAVKFLQRGNKELCRNMSSYLSLAAIAEAELLADHTDAIVKSVLQGMSIDPTYRVGRDLKDHEAPTQPQPPP
uniref:Ventricular zone expressed PH domain containing 1 n=1 Tax=Coturnix japonica TaxID=93934 RepID=A0A8C2U8R7_COTJA